jgi:hypothetical protein
VQQKRKAFVFGWSSNSVLAGFLAGVWIWLGTAACFPSLHGYLHSDSTTAKPHCAICSVAAGQVDISGDSAGPVCAPTPVTGPAPANRDPSLPSIDLRLPVSRAPPPLLFVS